MSITKNENRSGPDKIMEKAGFVAINYISCQPHYQERFEKLFASRAHAINRMLGYFFMGVLKPHKGGEYLIVSHWKDEKYFKA